MTDKVQKIREEVARIQLYTQSEVLEQVLDYIDKVQEEPVSEDLEEAAKEHAVERFRTTRDEFLAEKCKWSFKAGAWWQKQQMINGAVETIIHSKPNDYGEFMPIIHVKVGSSYKDGEKVRIIIIKEE